MIGSGRDFRVKQYQHNKGAAAPRKGVMDYGRYI